MGHTACLAQWHPFLPRRTGLAGATLDRGGSPVDRRLSVERLQTDLTGSESMAQRCHFVVLGAWALTRVHRHWRRDLGGGARWR
jgi:hypothetical protein